MRHYVRGEPRKITHQVHGAMPSGYDQNDVLRDIIWELKEDLDWTQSELGHRIGCSQSEANRFLHGKRISEKSSKPQEMKLSWLSRLCISIDENPLQVFGRHPLYEGVARAHMGSKDHPFTRHTVLLRNAEARGILSLLDEAGSSGVLDQAAQAIEAVVAAARVKRSRKDR